MVMSCWSLVVVSGILETFTWVPNSWVLSWIDLWLLGFSRISLTLSSGIKSFSSSSI